MFSSIISWILGKLGISQMTLVIGFIVLSVIGLVIGLGYHYVSNLQEKVITLTTENTRLDIDLKTEKDNNAILRHTNEVVARENSKFHILQEKNNIEIKKIQDKLSDSHYTIKQERVRANSKSAERLLKKVNDRAQCDWNNFPNDCNKGKTK
jgi:K+ transporter